MPLALFLHGKTFVLPTFLIVFPLCPPPHWPSHNLNDLKEDRKIYDSCSLFSASLRIKWNFMYRTSTYFTSYYFSGQSCPSYKESHPTSIHSLFLRSCQEESEAYCQCTQCKNKEFFFWKKKKVVPYALISNVLMGHQGPGDLEAFSALCHLHKWNRNEGACSHIRFAGDCHLGCYTSWNYCPQEWYHLRHENNSVLWCFHFWIYTTQKLRVCKIFFLLSLFSGFPKALLQTITMPTNIPNGSMFSESVV